MSVMEGLKYGAMFLLLSLVAMPVFAGSALAETGRKQFLHCSGCHTLTAEPVAGQRDEDFGPHLAGIINRPARAVSDFQYTDEMPGADFIWTEDNLERWLEKPQQMFPGVCMPFMGMRNPQSRRALIEYLKQAPQN